MPEYNKFNLGETGEKRLQNGFESFENSDIHKELGAWQSQDKLEKESATTVTKGCYNAIAPNGDAYFFSATDGAIFKRTQAGVYSSVRTNVNGSHKGCIYYNGYIYYSTDAHLGRFDLASNWNDSFQGLTTGKNHSMEQFDLILYICNDNDIASVDDLGVFSSSVLDLPDQHESVALKQFGDHLLILGNSDYITDSKIFRWTTYSDSWSMSDPIKEKVFAFIDADNYVFVIAVSGSIYQFSGKQLNKVFEIPEYTTFNAQLTCNYKGKALVANGSKIYSLYRKDNNQPFVLCGEYTCNGVIQSIRASGDDLLVSYPVGVDNVTSNKGMATCTTPLAFGKFSKVTVWFFELPTGSSIGIKTKIDGGAWSDPLDVIPDTEDSREVKLENDIITKRDVQVRVTINPNGEDTPIIDNIIIE